MNSCIFFMNHLKKNVNKIKFMLYISYTYGYKRFIKIIEFFSSLVVESLIDLQRKVTQIVRAIGFSFNHFSRYCAHS